MLKIIINFNFFKNRSNNKNKTTNINKDVKEFNKM